MEYLLDTANYEAIKSAMDVYPIDGITTNPTILSKEKAPYLEVLRNLDTLLAGKQFHIQLTATTVEDMLEEAACIKELIKSDLYIKIPVSKEGIKVMRILSSRGFKITATAVTSLNQGIMAAKAGATYLAFYVNRTTNTGVNGNDVIADIKTIFNRDGIDTKIIGASYKSLYQINESMLKGCDSVTVPEDLFEGMVVTEVTTKSVIKFTEDFTARYNGIGPKLYKE